MTWQAVDRRPGLVPLPRRIPNESLPPEATHAVGVARVSYAGTEQRWSSDMITLARVLGAMRADGAGGFPRWGR